MFIKIGNTGQIINTEKVEKFTVQKDRLDVRFASGHETAYYRSMMIGFDEFIGQVVHLLEEKVEPAPSGYVEYKYKRLEE